MDGKEEIKINLLIKECDSVGQGIRTLFLSTEKFIGFGFTIIAAGLAYGIKEKINEILLVLPFALIGALLYVIDVSTEINSLGGYKCHLEETINMALGKNVLLWELFIAKERHRPVVRLFLYLVYSLFLGFTIFISLSTAWRCYTTKSIFFCILITILLLTAGLIISLHKMNVAFNRTYQIARKQSEQNLLIHTSPNKAQTIDTKT
jgi:hypothetical protein